MQFYSGLRKLHSRVQIAALENEHFNHKPISCQHDNSVTYRGDAIKVADRAQNTYPHLLRLHRPSLQISRILLTLTDFCSGQATRSRSSSVRIDSALTFSLCG